LAVYIVDHVTADSVTYGTVREIIAPMLAV